MGKSQSFQSLETNLSTDNGSTLVGSVVGHDDPTTIIANTGGRGETSDASVSANSVSTANESLLQLDGSESKSVAESSLHSGSNGSKRSSEIGRKLNEVDRKDMEWQQVHQVSAIPENSLYESSTEDAGKYGRRDKRNNRTKGASVGGGEDPEEDDPPLVLLPSVSGEESDLQLTKDGTKPNSGNLRETDEIIRKVRERLSGDEIVRKVQERLSGPKQGQTTEEEEQVDRGADNSLQGNNLQHDSSSPRYEKSSNRSNKWISMEEGKMIEVPDTETTVEGTTNPSLKRVRQPMTTVQRILLLLIAVVVVSMVISLCIILLSNDD